MPVPLHCVGMTPDPTSPSAVPHGVTAGSVDQAVERLSRLGDAGIDQVIFSMANTTDPKAYPLVAEVVRQVA